MKPAPRQALLPFPGPELSAADLQSELTSVLQRPVMVRYGRAWSTPVRAEASTDGESAVRLHQFFAAAPPEIVAALGQWLKSGRRARRACSTLDAWLERQLLSAPRSRRTILRPRGRVYDLDSLAARCVEQYLPELAEAVPGLSFGLRRRSSTRRSLQLGSYDPHAHIVRIHPVLEHEDVPEFFIGFVLFHELLHAAVPSTTGESGRVAHHSTAFRQRERSHPDFAGATSWEERHLTRLMRRARRAKFD